MQTSPEVLGTYGIFLASLEGVKFTDVTFLWRQVEWCVYSSLETGFTG